MLTNVFYPRIVEVIMWPAIVGAAAGNAFSPSKSIGEYYFGRWSAAEQNWENQKAMDKQNAWTEAMSNTAHQREVEDLENAGLNPVLSSGGSGASSPASASPGQMNIPAMHFPAVHGVGELFQNQQKINNETAKTQADIAKTEADIGKKGAEKTLTEAKATLAKKGMIRAEVEGKAAGVVDKVLNYMTNPTNWMQKKQVTPERQKQLDDWMY